MTVRRVLYQMERNVLLVYMLWSRVYSVCTDAVYSAWYSARRLA